MTNRIALCIAALCVASLALADRRTVELGEDDILLMEVPEGLTFAGTAATKGRPGGVALKDAEGVCEMRIKFVAPKQVPSKEQLKESLEKSAERLLPNAVEQKIDVQELPDSKFAVVYFQLTDKREDGGDGRYMLQGLGVSGRHVCQFMMLMQQKTSPGRTAVLKALSSMEMTKKK